MVELIDNWERIQEGNSKKKVILDYKKISNIEIEIEGIDHIDAPDFCDAFIANAYYDGRLMTEEELEEINEDGDFVNSAVMEWLY